MNMKKLSIVIIASVLVLAILLVSAAMVSNLKTAELARADITVYADELSVSDVYRVLDSDMYFFIVWAGKQQEGYYIDFENKTLSLAMRPEVKDIGKEQIKTRQAITQSYGSQLSLECVFSTQDNEVEVYVEDMGVNNYFKTRPQLFGKKLEFIFNE
jgi:hypothetical protein